MLLCPILESHLEASRGRPHVNEHCRLSLFLLRTKSGKCRKFRQLYKNKPKKGEGVPQCRPFLAKFFRISRQATTAVRAT
jgi:hypothetical protein